MTERSLNDLRAKHRDWVQERLRRNADRLPTQVFDYDDSDGSALVSEGTRVVSSLPSRLSLRLSGERLHRGAIDTVLFGDIVGPVQAEIRAASNDSDASRLELVGISSGSTILHFEPALGSDARMDKSSIAPSDVLERSVLRVFDVHDLVENESGGETLRSDFSRGLIDSFSRLTRGLLDHDVELDMLWRSPNGVKRPSRLGSRGLRYAQSLFDKAIEVDEHVVAGYVFTMSLNGELVLKANPAKKRSATYHISIDSTENALSTFSLNDYVRVLTRRTIERDQLGQVQSTVYEFRRVVGHQEQLSGLDEG